LQHQKFACKGNFRPRGNAYPSFQFLHLRSYPDSESTYLHLGLLGAQVSAPRRDAVSRSAGTGSGPAGSIDIARLVSGSVRVCAVSATKARRRNPLAPDIPAARSSTRQHSQQPPPASRAIPGGTCCAASTRHKRISGCSGSSASPKGPAFGSEANSSILNHPNFADPTNMLTSPLFGRSTQTLANSLGSGGANGGFNPLYQIGGPRSAQLALKLVF
jgi:hypothetical protein